MGGHHGASPLFVILGGTGDLSRRKLFPALSSLMRQGLIDESSLLLGVARDTEHNDESFRALIREALLSRGLSPDDVGRWCEACLRYQTIGKGAAEDFRALASRIEALEREHQLSGNRVLYLALPPGAYPGTITGLGEAGLNRSPGWTRLVIEKPFGSDLTSARDLHQLVHSYFEESDIYRLDHYLGKETVQNLLVFRFSNPIFESLWNRDRVQSIQITVAEELGIEQRASYYEQAGATRDMVQNHLTQLVTLVGMEVPSTFSAAAVRYEKTKVLRSIAPVLSHDVVFGQYARGTINGREVPGYLEEPGVAPDSRTETFVAMKLEVDTWRWQGVPFYIRTGKRFPQRLTQIAVTFRRPPVYMFDSLGFCPITSNVLLLSLQPDEGFSLFFDVKKPGEPFMVETVPLTFRYGETFGALPDAYETLLLDVLTGDQTLFVHADEVEGSWQIYTPILEKGLDLHPYQAGTWGPEAADRLLHQHGHTWYTR